jgi:hypothetical protein
MLSAITQQDASVGNALVDAIHKHLEAAFACDRLGQIRSVYRFLAYCAELQVLDCDLLVESAFMPLLMSLSNGKLDNRNDVYASTVMSSLFIAPNAFKSHLGRLLPQLHVYIQARTTSESRTMVLDALRPYDPTRVPFDQPDYLLFAFEHLLLTLGIAEIPANEDGYSSLEINPQLLPIAIWPQSFIISDSQITSIVLPGIQLPEHSSLPHFDAPPAVVFRVFDDDLAEIPGTQTEFIPQVPPTRSAERFLCTEMLHDLLINIQFNHKEGVRYLMDLKLMFLEGTFVLDTDEAAVVGPSQGAHPDKPMYNFEQLLMECIFVSLFRLPQPQVRPIFYTDVVMGLCRLSPKRIAPALGKCLQVLFGRLEFTDPDCLIRLVDFFSHHLSNFTYGWNWKDWTYVLPGLTPEGMEETDLSMRRTFLVTVLERVTRLAYFDRIKSALPPTYEDEYKKLEPKATPLFANDVHLAFGEQVVDQIRARISVDELIHYCDQFARNTPEPTGNPQYLRHAVINALLMHGQKTFSHTMTVLERCLPLVKKVAGDSSSKIHLISCVYAFWRHNHQFFLIVLDKLLHYRVCEPTHVVGWLTAVLNEDPIAEALPPGTIPVRPNGDLSGDDDMQVEEYPSNEINPVYILEVIVLTIKKALHRIDYLEDRIKQTENSMGIAIFSLDHF